MCCCTSRMRDCCSFCSPNFSRDGRLSALLRFSWCIRFKPSRCFISISDPHSWRASFRCLRCSHWRRIGNGWRLRSFSWHSKVRSRRLRYLLLQRRSAQRECGSTKPQQAERECDSTKPQQAERECDSTKPQQAERECDSTKPQQMTGATGSGLSLA